MVCATYLVIVILVWISRGNCLSVQFGSSIFSVVIIVVVVTLLLLTDEVCVNFVLVEIEAENGV